MSRRNDDETDEEFRFHLDQQIEEYMREGMSPEEARRKAKVKLGKPLSARESMRDLQPWRWLENIVQDMRYGLRGLLRNPSFSLTALLSITLGIGATIAIFTLADNILLRDLPYRDPERLVMLWETRPARGTLSNVVSPADFLEWKARTTAFESMSIFSPGTRSLGSGDHLAELETQSVGLDLLPMFGIAPIRGRFFARQDLVNDNPQSVIISYRLWQGWFGGAEDTIGRKVLVGASPRTIVGIMPPGFYFRTVNVDFWQPMELNPSIDYRQSSGRYLLALGKLKPGVSVGQATTQLQSVAQQLEVAYPAFSKSWSARAESLHDSQTQEVSASLKLLLAAAGLLLAISCSNVANLMLARFASRHGEISVRLSLGASPWRLVRQVMAESLLLGMIGGISGLIVARLLVTGLLVLAPKSMIEKSSIVFDERVVFASFAVSIFCGLIFGLAPASMLFKSRLESAHRGGVASGMRLRTWLVAAEVALSVLLLIGAGLMFRSFTGLQSTESGLNPQNVLTFRVSLPNVKYETGDSQVQFYQALLGRLQTLPGAIQTSGINTLPFLGIPSGTSIHVYGTPPAKPGESLSARIRTAMPNYFQTMMIPLKAGRDFTPADQVSAAPLRFIVNESFLKFFAAGSDPMSHKLRVNMQDVNPYGEVIGVVGDVKEGTLDSDPRPTVYYPYGKLLPGSLVVTIRSANEPNLMLSSARETLRQLDSQIPMANPKTMNDVLADTYSRQRMSAWLLSTFSLLALALAAIGIYGIQAYAVTERTREIGVRIALGASGPQIKGMILARAIRIIVTGLMLGMTAAFLLTSYLKSMLFGVTPYDPLSFSVVPLVLLVIGLIAAYLPARRASRLDPIEALHADVRA